MGAVSSSAFSHVSGENSSSSCSMLPLVEVFCKLRYLKANLERRQDCLYRPENSNFVLAFSVQSCKYYNCIKFLL